MAPGVGLFVRQRSAQAVKKLVVKATVFVLFAGLVSSAVVRGDGNASPAVEPSPHKIGLIDMARVFKSYKKFEAMRDELKGELTKSEEKFKAMTEQIKKETAELKGYKEGTEEYSRVEKTLLTHTTQAEAFRKGQQRDLIRKEAQIYKTIYLEVSDAVERYAQHFKFTLVLRFSADELNGQENPEDVMRGLNRQVVYYRPSEDITSAICTFLNNRYGRMAAAPPTEGNGAAR
jgi:Skp family chaperone for outer membrane proteins